MDTTQCLTAHKGQQQSGPDMHTHRLAARLAARMCGCLPHTHNTYTKLWMYKNGDTLPSSTGFQDEESPFTHAEVMLSAAGAGVCSVQRMRIAVLNVPTECQRCRLMQKALKRTQSFCSSCCLGSQHCCLQGSTQTTPHCTVHACV